MTDVRRVCQAIDESAAVYDFALTPQHVAAFLDTLQWTYSFSSVAGVHDAIDWQGIRADAASAFNVLAQHRKSVDQSRPNGTISLRYDSRALVAVIRSRLPPHEILVGPTIQGIDHAFYGIYSDMTHYDLSAWPLSSCVVAGGSLDPCEKKKPSSSSFPAAGIAAAIIPMIVVVAM